MSFIKHMVLASLIFLTPLSCKSVRSLSETKHDAGRFLNSSDPALWGDATELEYEQRQVRSYAKMLPIDHELTKRMQFWADAIRDKMIAVMPEVSHIPAPLVRILKSDSINAFAEPMNVTFFADIVTPSGGDPIPEGSKVVLGGSCFPNCKELSIDLEAKRHLLEITQKRSNPNCTVAIENDRLQMAESCLEKPGVVYKGPKHFNQFNTIKVLNYVSILSESIKNMSEPEIVVVLAHELAHYYMAHPIYIQSADINVPYNYPYLKSQHIDSGKPTPLSPNDPNYNHVKDLDDTVDISYPVFEGQKYPTILDIALAKSIGQGLQEGKIADRCVTGTDVSLCLNQGYEVTTPGNALTNWAFFNKKDMFNPEVLAKGAALALQFEAALAKNASILRSSDLKSLQKVLSEDLGRGAPPVTIASLDESVESFLPAYVETAKKAIEENPKIVAALTKSVSESGLGFYTVEQEADDISIEIIYELGFDPSIAVTCWLNFLDRSEESPSKKEACRANYATGFKTPVWIGLSTEPHHNHCYRAYNAFNEINNHRAFFDKNKIPKTPIAPGAKWEDLVATMKGKSFVALPPLK